MEFGVGNIGFMLIATALVMLMTPGLAFFYGGLVGSKNVVAVMMHSFVSLGGQHHSVVRSRIFTLVQRGRRRRHRQPRLGVP